MEDSKNIGSNENVNILLTFISETRQGKFTPDTPAVQITYQRFDIQEQESTPSDAITDKNELVLFGVS